MKKTVFFLLLSSFLLLNQPTHAQEITWQNLEKTCFLNFTKIENIENKTVKIRNYPQNHLFFVQNNKALPYKIFEHSKTEKINYTVLDLFSEDLTQAKYLQDGNFNTFVEPLNFYGKELLLDAGRVLEARSFEFILDFEGSLKPRFYISKNQKDYQEINDINQFAWRYLKITFGNYSPIDSRAYPLKINEIRLVQEGMQTYLLNPKDNTELEIYANYQCKLEKAIQLQNELKKQLNQEKFSLDAKSQLYTINWEKNPVYNSDFDNDDLENNVDNCPFDFNPKQEDIDFDLVGDVCDFDNETQNFSEKDTDQDNIGDSLDNCPYIYNPKQIDTNADKKGDLCMDDDQDGIIGKKDNCVNVANADQKDININGIGDACEFDKDEDGIFDSVDNCITQKNPNQEDRDQDGIGNLCDNCELYNPSQIDKDQNGKGDVCDEAEKNLAENDEDQDGIIDFKDNCPKIANANQADEDKDGTGDVCDNCPKIQNPEQIDQDKNGVGDLCEDVDGDGKDGYLDNCVYFANADQKDTDNDGIGDECEDDDHDGLVAAEDNCPFDYNKEQWDNDRDGIGDKCDPQDNRFIESNKYFVLGGIVFVVLIFGIMIFAMVRKLKKI